LPFPPPEAVGALEVNPVALTFLGKVVEEGLVAVNLGLEAMEEGSDMLQCLMPVGERSLALCTDKLNWVLMNVNIIQNDCLLLVLVLVRLVN
jgi:hypothetical protein